jgi:ATP-binding cassette subfamily B protein
MSYTLTTSGGEEKKKALEGAWESLAPLLRDEKINLAIALIAVLINSGANLLAPIVIAHVIDTAIATDNFAEVLRESAILGGVYIIGLIAAYMQTIRMGTVGRGVLFKLRNALFNKLSELPIAFFNQNKAGDLISRINNDTDKLNQFFSQALMQFIGSFFVILGAGILLLVLNWRLGVAALLPALAILLLTQLLSPWVKRKSRDGLQSLGALSAEVQESIANFKVIVAFDRLDYFRQKLSSLRNCRHRFELVGPALYRCRERCADTGARVRHPAHSERLAYHRAPYRLPAVCNELL